MSQSLHHERPMDFERWVKEMTDVELTPWQIAVAKRVLAGESQIFHLRRGSLMRRTLLEYMSALAHGVVYRKASEL